MKKKMYNLCEYIGDWYGQFFMEDGKYCINNYQKVFKYDSMKELLIDWLGTLECDMEDNGTNWTKEIKFIKFLKMFK